MPQFQRLICLSALFIASATVAAKTEPQRIAFAPGARSKTVRGHLAKSHAQAFYIVKMRAGQKLSIKVSLAEPQPIATSVVPMLFVTTPMGQKTGDKTRRFDTQKTVAGDYQVRVAVNQMATNGEAGNFLLKVWAR